MPPEENHASVSLKTLLLVFGVLVVVALGYLVWAQNSDPDATDYTAPSVKKTEATTITGETADWKTYTNAILAITIKYPADWKLTNETNLDAIKDANTAFGGGSGYLQLSPVSTITQKPGQDMEVGQKLEISINPTNKSLDEEVLDAEHFTSDKQITLGLYKWSVGKTTNFGNQTNVSFKAISVIPKQFSGRTEKSLALSASGYTFTGPENSRYDEDFAKMCEKILATIKIN